VQFKVNPYFLVNASARWSILKGKGAINLRGTDLFYNLKLAFSSSNPFPQTGSFTLEYSSIYLAFLYNFGSGKRSIEIVSTETITKLEGVAAFYKENKNSLLRAHKNKSNQK